jgi:hypothetical protein
LIADGSWSPAEPAAPHPVLQRIGLLHRVCERPLGLPMLPGVLQQVRTNDRVDLPVPLVGRARQRIMSRRSGPRSALGPEGIDDHHDPCSERYDQPQELDHCAGETADLTRVAQRRGRLPVQDVRHCAEDQT